jgi:hypothetical protein
MFGRQREGAQLAHTPQANAWRITSVLPDPALTKATAAIRSRSECRYIFWDRDL